MISKNKKLSKTDFQNIRNLTVKKANTKLGLVFSLNVNKFSITIPKKLYKKSHDRNTVKRLFYNIIKDVQSGKLSIPSFSSPRLSAHSAAAPAADLGVKQINSENTKQPTETGKGLVLFLKTKTTKDIFEKDLLEILKNNV